MTSKDTRTDTARLSPITARRGGPGETHRAGCQRADVSEDPTLTARWRDVRATGGLDASDARGQGGGRSAGDLPLPRCAQAPVHIGDPSALGIKDVDSPDYGDR